MDTTKPLYKMTRTEIEEEYGLLFPCTTCGAQPQGFCHRVEDPKRPAQMHRPRLRVLDRMWQLGWQAKAEYAQRQLTEAS